LESFRKRFLVVERDEIVLALITHILTRRGFAVEARTRAPAAEALQSDAALIDWESITFEWLLAFLDANPALRRRVILLGEPEPADPPVFAVVPKPVDVGVLVETVTRCVETD